MIHGLAGDFDLDKINTQPNPYQCTMPSNIYQNRSFSTTPVCLWHYRIKRDDCNKTNWGATSEKLPSNITVQNAKIRIILRMRKVSPDLCSPFIHSVVSNYSVSGQ